MPLPILSISGPDATDYIHGYAVGRIISTATRYTDNPTNCSGMWRQYQSTATTATTATATTTTTTTTATTATAA
jgi:hypothetical protein